MTVEFSEDFIGVIPARGGSKGIPRKNLIPLLGKPLIAWSIEHALQSKNISRVIVSTDDEEIAEVALKFGAEVPFIRPAKYASDSSLDIEVFRHLLDWLEANESNIPENLVHLRPTGPARCIADINKAIEIFHACKDCDSLRSVCRSQQTPYKMWLEENGFLKSVAKDPGIHDYHSQPRQKLPKVYWQNGYIDIIKSKTILNFNSMVGEKCLSFICSNKVHDIDYMDDVPIVESLLKQICNNEIKTLNISDSEFHSV